jgi:predicted aconitase with swiveling domain
MSAGRIIVPGRAAGRLLRLAEPISFWGGVDPATGRVSQPRHADFGADLAGAVVAIPETIGSSSGSAVMLELLRIGRAPAALVLGSVDAILVLGVLVAREMGWATIPVIELGRASVEALPRTAPRATVDGANLTIG